MSHKGYKQSDVHKQHISEANKKAGVGKWMTGRVSPKKGKGNKSICQSCFITFSASPFSIKRGGGKFCSRKCFVSSNSGSNSHLWKGGITPINEKVRKSVEYKLWRQAVFIRDQHTCQHCNKIGGELHADHIKPFAYFPELRFAIDNGRTLCIECHRKTDTYGYKAGQVLTLTELNK